MTNNLLFHPKPFYLLHRFLFSITLISLLAFTGDKHGPKKPIGPLKRTTLAGLPKTGRSFDSDPIKFMLQANKQTVAPGEEVTITITAHYLNIHSALLFTMAGSNAFRLKLLLPDGFVQTGGDYVDYMGTELSAVQPTVSYTLRGYFSKPGNLNEFRLLRGSYQADANSLFVEKSRLTLRTVKTDLTAQLPGSARTATGCNYTEGQYLFTFNTEQMYAHYYNSVLYAAYQDGSNFRPQHWLTATGLMDATTASCFAENDPHTTTTTPTTPTGGSGNGLSGNYFNNQSLSGSPALSRTDATINFTWNESNSPFPGVNATNMSVRWEGQVEAPVSGAYTFLTNNDDATNLWVNGQQLISDWPGGYAPLLKQGTINLVAGQKYSIKLEFNQGGGGAQAQLLWSYPGQGQQIIPQSRLYSNGYTTTTTTPTGNCAYTEGQYLFTFNTEVMYAHYYNGVLYAGYQDGSNFKPQHWLTATGLMNATAASCFAENDPHTTGSGTGGGNVGGDTGNPSGGSGNGLLGNYFNNQSLSGSPALSRTDATINFTWNESNSPFPGVNATNMSVRWEGQVEAPVSGAYTFLTNNDDATNLWVNGQQLISDWPGGHAPLLKQGTINLVAGQKYSIKLEFNQGGGGAQAQLLWSYPGQDQQIIPQSRLYSNGTTTTNPTSGCGTGSGLSGFFANTTDLSGPLIAMGNAAQINFTWNGSPVPNVVNADGFSARWFGQVEAPISGNYTFKTNNDDGTRLWVNGQLLIDDWNGHGPTWQQGSIYLTGGQKYDIVIDYFDAWGGAQAQLYWEYPGQSLQLVPSCRLYPSLPISVQTSSNTNALVAGAESSCSTEGYCVTFWYGCVSGTFVMAQPAATCPGIPNEWGGPRGTGGGGGSVPGGPTTPSNVPIFNSKGSNISPLITGKAVEDFTFTETIAVQKQIFRELGITSIDQLEQPPYFPPVLFPYWLDQMHQVSREYNVLKLLNPGWSDFKCLVQAYRNVYSGKVHFLLDVLGTIPGAGEPADAINGGIYLLEGDNTNAALSFAATLPIGGWAATAGKWARNALKYDGIYNGVARFVSQHGLNFTIYGKAENRLDHVFLHMSDVPPTSNKGLHGVFYGTTSQAISAVDEAWEIVKRNNIQPTVDPKSGNWNYIVDMGRPIGWEGGKNGSKGPLNHILIATKPNNDAILVTAFPSIP